MLKNCLKQINKTFNIKSEAYSIDYRRKVCENCCEAIKNKFGKIDD